MRGNITLVSKEKQSWKIRVELPKDTLTGKRKQKWESYKTMADANRRKAEIEYKQELGNFVIPKCTTINDLLKEYVAIYGKTTWSLSCYQSNDRRGYPQLTHRSES